MDQLQACSERSQLHVNLMISTELLVPGPDIDALDQLLEAYETLGSPLPWPCASLAPAALGQFEKT